MLYNATCMDVIILYNIQYTQKLTQTLLDLIFLLTNIQQYCDIHYGIILYHCYIVYCEQRNVAESNIHLLTMRYTISYMTYRLYCEVFILNPMPFKIVIWNIYIIRHINLFAYTSIIDDNLCIASFRAFCVVIRLEFQISEGLPCNIRQLTVSIYYC